ncbi:DUF6157 family protein [Microbacterium esteraromaticum]|uniref:DUF6157 family protein n=1 Tax=Microbacterium esteraromaticum TaxID=57043 RepID=UPI0030B05381
MTHTTNYVNTFIEVSDDCPVEYGVEPPIAENLSIAALHYRLLSDEPYTRTSDDLLFETHALRKSIDPADADARAEFFSKGQACLRASPLSKRYGWGTHHDEQGRVAMFPRDSEEYAALAADPSIEHKRAMRSSRRS